MLKEKKVTKGIEKLFHLHRFLQKCNITPQVTMENSRPEKAEG